MGRLLSIVLALGLVVSLSLATAVPVLAFTEVWVDDDAPGDPSPGDPSISDPLEDGTPAHPFDEIQEAIDYVALDPEGGIVNVLAGTYNENIDLANGVEVLGAGASVTTINAGGSGRVVNADSITSTTAIDGFTITGGNTDYGGGIYNNGASPIVSNCVITGNTAANHGSGMYNLNSSSPTVVNCVFSNNTAGSRGGGVYIDSTSSPTLTNCTIADNTATQGGGIYTSGTSPIITNNIIASNTATTGEGIYCATPTLIIDYNDVYNNTLVNCTSNNDPAADPDFIDAVYHIDSDSPCIDVGNNGAPSLPTTDFDGEPRVFDGDIIPGAVVDMGADEYFVNSPPNNPTNLSPPEYVDGSTVSDNTPTLTFDQSDPDVTDTVQYTIEIDNDSDFSSPAVSFTSALLAQGGASFTSPSLPDDDYYWRVMSTDQWGAPSGWTYANGGAVAFSLDTTPAGGGTVGGEARPIDKAALLLPWLVLGAILVLAAGGLIMVRRRSS